MTESFEIIDGHRYLVKRDDGGKIVSQSGADDLPVLELPADVRAALAKADSSFTLSDVAALLKFVTRAVVK